MAPDARSVFLASRGGVTANAQQAVNEAQLVRYRQQAMDDASALTVSRPPRPSSGGLAFMWSEAPQRRGDEGLRWERTGARREERARRRWEGRSEKEDTWVSGAIKTVGGLIERFKKRCVLSERGRVCLGEIGSEEAPNGLTSAGLVLQEH